MTIKQFAAAHSLKMKSEDDTKIIPGIDDSHIYQHDEARFGVMYMDTLARDYSTFRKQCEAAGMEVTQDGDTEFAATFDPKSEKQSKLAIRVAGCRFPGRRESTTPKNFVNCVVLQKGASENFASESLG